MKPRTAIRLAWSIGALTLVLACAFLVLAFLNGRGIDNLSIIIVGATSVIVGGLVASRRPVNPIGWLFLGGALFSTLRSLTGEYALYGIKTEPGALPIIQMVTGFSNAIQIIGPVMLFILVPLYFPTGRPVSRRWGLVGWLALGMLPVFTILTAILPGTAVYGTDISNPWAIESMRQVVAATRPFLFAYFIGLIFASAASLILRLWRSRGVERQQIKWFTFAAAFIPIWFMTNGPIDRSFPTLFAVMDAMVISATSVAAGIAILRYRLYDIDVIINRTLVYGSLTVMLVGIYLGAVISLQYALRVIIGQESQLAIVASTLVIAALFNPLRGLMQTLIDRRFYRKKYSAARAMEDFSAKLRREMNLDQLNTDLRATIEETMQPRHVSLWLRMPEEHDRVSP